MGKSVNNDVLNAALDKIATASILTVCASEPTNRVEAVTTFALASTVMTPGDGNGDYVISNGDTSGQKIRVQQKSDLNIDSSGSAQHIAICDATILLYVTTCTTQPLTAGGTVTVPAWDVEIADPI